MVAVIGFFDFFGSYSWGWVDQKIGTRKVCLIYCVCMLLPTVSDFYE